MQEVNISDVRDILDEIVSAIVNSSGSIKNINKPCIQNNTVVMISNATSSITSLKETVDNQCDALFELESLEPDGPADSWLLSTEISTSAQPGNEHMFCKGPSWNRFVDKLTAQQNPNVAVKQRVCDSSGTPSLAAAHAQRPEAAAADLGSDHTIQQQNRNSLLQTAGPTESKQVISQQLKHPLSSQESNAQCCTSSPAAAPEGNNTSTADGTGAYPLCNAGLPGIIQANSETHGRGRNILENTTSSRQAYNSSTTAANGLSSVVNTESISNVLQTPVRSARSSGGGTMQEAESAAWMASLRSAPISSGSSRRLSRTQSASGTSPHTPVQPHTKLGHSRSTRVSASGANTTSPTTPSASSRSVPASTGRHDADRMLAHPHGSSSSSRKYSLRRSCPSSLVAAAVASSSEHHAGVGSYPRSPVLSPTGKSVSARKPLRDAGKAAQVDSCSQKPNSCVQKRASDAATGSAKVDATPNLLGPSCRGPNSGRFEYDLPLASAPVQLTPEIAASTKAAVRAKAAADAARATAQQLLQATMRTTGDSATDVPLPASCEQDEVWAADATAVQLFMDEYKEVLDAVDSAYTGCSTAAAAEQQEASCDEAAAALHREISVLSNTSKACESPAASGTAAAMNVAPALETPAVPTSWDAISSHATTMQTATGDSAGAVEQSYTAATDTAQTLEALAACQKDSKDVVQAGEQQVQLSMQRSTDTPACGCRCIIM